MARSPERLIQLARSVNDHVVGKHIGDLCRELADALEHERVQSPTSLPPPSQNTDDAR